MRCFKGSSSVPKTSPIFPHGLKLCMPVVYLFLACTEPPGNNSAPCLAQRGTVGFFAVFKQPFPIHQAVGGAAGAGKRWLDSGWLCAHRNLQHLPLEQPGKGKAAH